MQILRKQLFRWAFTTQNITPGGVLQNSSQKLSIINQLEIDELPIHLRQYDAKKYEVPSTKLKVTTGYAFLDVEPVPRAKIMKICYIVLEKLKVIPEQALYRIYTEEKMKYIMKITDQIDDIQRLEEEFGFEAIEYFIQSLYQEIRLVDVMKEGKPWDKVDGDESFEMLRQKRPDAVGHIAHRHTREPVKFIN